MDQISKTIIKEGKGEIPSKGSTVYLNVVGTIVETDENEKKWKIREPKK